MKLVLDEMWDHEIAVQLRGRGIDAIAATEPEHASRYRHVDDPVFFERAREDGRAIVTDNIGDYEPLRLDCERRGQRHHGVIYALSPAFDRHHGEAIVGLMVRALEQLVYTLPPAQGPADTAHWLQRARDR